MKEAMSTTTSDSPVERIDQNRQIGLACVTRPNKNGQGAEVDLRFLDRPQVGDIDLQGGVREYAVHKLL